MILNWGLVFLGLGNGDFPNLKNTNSQFKITNWSFYHQLVISTFSSHMWCDTTADITILQRGRGYLAARDGDWVERDHPGAHLPLLECSARDNTGIHQIFTTLLQLSGTRTTPVFFLITHPSSFQNLCYFLFLFGFFRTSLV